MFKPTVPLAVLSFCLCSTVASSAAAPPAASPEEIVRAYTDAANRHELESFLALYAPTIRKFRFPGQLTSEVVHDRVTGRPDGKTAEEITVYQVQEGRITNIVYVEQSVL